MGDSGSDPLDVDLWIPEMIAIPGVTDSKGKQKYMVDPRIALSDQIIDVLDALRLDMRSPEPEGGLEVRTFVVGDNKYPPPRLLRETVPNAKPGSGYISRRPYTPTYADMWTVLWVQTPRTSGITAR